MTTNAQKNSPIWSHQPLRRPQLRGHIGVDVAVIGGGFAGLSAAYHLLEREPGLRVALLEAGDVGEGASGRNTGLLGPGAVAPVTRLAPKLGLGEARAVFGASVDAVRHVKALVTRAGLRCELEESAQFKTSMTPSQTRFLAREASLLASMGFDVDHLGRGALSRHITSPVYDSAMRYGDAATLNPAKLCAELGRVIVERGGELYERSPVIRWSRGDRISLETPRGAVTAGRLVIAAGPWLADLGVQRGRVIPLFTHVLATEPLGHRLDALGWPGREGIVDGRQLFSYFRLSSDDRLVFGGGRPLYQMGRVGAGRAARRRTYRALMADLLRIFPQLSGVEVTHAWSGPMGFTLDGAPVIGPLDAQDPRVIVSGGFCGHGVALATWSGERVAEWLLDGEASLPVSWRRRWPTRLPPEPLRKIGLGAYLRGLELRDRVDLGRAA